MNSWIKYIFASFVLCAIVFLPQKTYAQQTLVMPHHGIDTLTIDHTQCYTILDPGGLANYSNNEDSWLLITSTSGYFKLSINYETSLGGDCNDYLHVFQGNDTNRNNLYTQICGKGETYIWTWSNQIWLHFHSNNYASFSGFEISVAFPNTISNWNAHSNDDGCITLSWNDATSNATGWTVTYFCDEDSLMTATTNTRSITLNGLRNNTHYAYYIQNNVTACMEKEQRYFILPNNQHDLYNGSETDNINLTSGVCYSVNGLSGPSTNRLRAEWSEINLNTPDSVGFYAIGWHLLNNDYFHYSWSIGNNLTAERSYWSGQRRNHTIYFPHGRANFSAQNYAKYHYDLFWENNRVVTPIVSSVTSSTADIQWTDTTQSTSWTFRYTCDDDHWITRSTTTPSITLTGLSPATQYVYTIEGNHSPSCVTPYRHAFITTAPADTIIMPYRKNDTVVLLPGNCYTVVDAGGSNHNFFHSDFSTYTLRTATGQPIRVRGWYHIPGDNRLFIRYDGQWHSYNSSNSAFEIHCPDGECTIALSSTADENGAGFLFDIIQLDTAITQLTTSDITDTSATLSWNDPLPGTAGWVVHYGDGEDNFRTLLATTPTAQLTGLTPGTQYVYYISRQQTTAGSQCTFSDRRAFVTQGLPTNTLLMPFRSTDTLVITPGTCYTIYDAGGKDHNYFNNDTGTLVIMTADHSKFYITGQFEYDNYYEFQLYSYDNEDQLSAGTVPGSPDSYNYIWNGQYTWYNNREFRAASQNGFLRLRWRSNEKNTRKGFCLHIDQEAQPVQDIQFNHIKQNTAEIAWSDYSGYSGPWYIGYSPDSVWTTVTSNTPSVTLTNLLAGTQYQLHIGRAPFTEGCNLATHAFTTLHDNDIVMNLRSRDTVWITPGECYTVYDPGGLGDYYASDTSVLVIRSTTGLGFYMEGYAEVSDYLSFEPNGDWGGSYYWRTDRQFTDGIAHLTLITNEALNSPGFAFKITFFPTLHSLDTLWQNDTAMAITWQDTSAATRWNVTYGLSMDSLQTISTTVPNATLTGLHRNAQCYIRIESDISANACMIPSIYGILMPHDPDIWITQYVYDSLNYINRHSLVERNSDILPVNGCIHIYDNGGLNPPFPNDDHTHYFYTADGRGASLEGHYNVGNGFFYLYSNQGFNYYNGIGDIHSASESSSFDIYSRTASGASDNGEGFDFIVQMNYGIHQITTSAVTCSTARLTWVDTSGATRWWIAFGEDETHLDTTSVLTRSYQFSGLQPNRQYVCYLWSNESSSNCLSNIKRCFITACDSSLIIMPFNQDQHYNLDINRCYTIQDIGGPNNYHYNGRQSIHLHTNTGDPITLRGWVRIREGDYLNIYDGSTWEWYRSNWSGENDNFLIQSSSGHLYIEFVSNDDNLSESGFEFSVLFNTIGNIRPELMTDTSCRIVWDDHSTADHWTLFYGPDRQHMDSISTDTKRVHLSHLANGIRYYVYITNNATECIDTTWFEFCAGADNCIDFANLYSCHTICRYGTFASPDTYEGVIDYGPDDINSRHTVLTDTSYRDPRTGNLLRGIPEGHDHSVRLGNWNIGGEAESIAYEYLVDTSVADMLLLRYAAVLENPGHQNVDQPRFQFTFTDENNNPIDTRCYSADFISSNQLDWNLYQYDTNTVLWKNWTAVGVDLEPLHGQRVYVKLTTYDCAQTGHFGYAYFTIECDHKHVYTGDCGIVDTNSFTAPEGFRYAWYNVDSSNVILDTSRYFHSDAAGVYRCRASFIGDSSASCYFEKTVVVGDILPHADFAYRPIDTNGCNVTLRFQNLSSVLLAGSPTDMECDYFLWDFGNGDTSYERHPARTFEPGYAEVRLTAFLADGLCSHDTLLRIAIPSPCIHYDTLHPHICAGDTLHIGDSAFSLPGQYVVTRRIRPDSIRQSLVILSVHNVYQFDLVDTICHGETYNQHGITRPDGSLPNSTGHYEKRYLTVNTCDSIYRLELVVMPTYDTSVAAIACSDSGYALFNDTVYVSGHYDDSLLSVHGCDSVIHLNLFIRPAYHTYTVDSICEGNAYPFHDSIFRTPGQHTALYHTILGCDSAFHLDLTLNSSYHFYDTVRLCPRERYLYLDTFYLPPVSLTNAYSTILMCDSVYHIQVNLKDTLFFPAWQVTDDTSHWFPGSPLVSPLPDTLWEGCSPFTLYFRNRSIHALSSLWDFGDSATHSQGASPYDTNQFISHTFTTGHYHFSLFVTDSFHCVDTLASTAGVHVIEPPTASFYWDTTFPSAIHPWAEFTNNSVPLDSTCSFLWLFENPASEGRDSSREVNPTYRWQADDLQTPELHAVWLIETAPYTGLTGNTIYCSDTLIDTVKIMPVTVKFPNMVSPNGDGVNDVFRINNLVEYQRYPNNNLTIYNRWGNVVYRIENIHDDTQFWNPDDTCSPDGTYFFRFVGQGTDGGVQHNGVIEVLR